MFDNMFQMMGIMFLFILSGAFMRKVNIINEKSNRFLANLILGWILPCNIVRAFLSENHIGFWDAFIKVLIVASCVQVLCLVLNQFLFQNMSKKERQVYKYATVCSNAGFIGNSLAQGVFGSIGQLYASLFLIPLRIMMWTAGVSYFSNECNKKKLLEQITVHPCMIAVYIGMGLMISGIEIPTVAMKSLTAFSDCCAPLTMAYIGAILADIDFRGLVTKNQIYFAFIRLFLLPAIVFGGCLWFAVDPLVTGVCVLLTAMPAGSTTSLLATQYSGDEVVAAKCVAFTTIISVIATPIWGYIIAGILI